MLPLCNATLPNKFQVCNGRMNVNQCYITIMAEVKNAIFVRSKYSVHCNNTMHDVVWCYIMNGFN